MRELHGVMAAHLVNDRRDLKKRALMFDAIHVVGLQAGMSELDRVLAIHDVAPSTGWPELRAEFDYLLSRGFLVDAEVEHVNIYDEPIPEPTSPDSLDLDIRQQSAFAVRTLACNLEAADCQAVPIFDSIDGFYFSARRAAKTADVMGIALEAFPVPGDDSSWADILDFKEEHRDKEWALRRFLRGLTTKAVTEAEIRDELEWMQNEYANSMKLHNLKATGCFFEVYVIPAIEIIEDIVKLNWSKIVRGALSVRNRKIELMEAEMRAPGRECAYVFDARQKFNK